MKKYLNKNKKYDEFYILKLDISKYFYSIDHDVLKSLLKDKLNDCEYNIICSFIDSTVDDFILIHHDKEYLKYIYKIIINKLNMEYKLKINTNKTMILKASHGFVFLGSRYRVINKKTIINISSSKRNKIRKNIRRKRKLYDMGYISYKSYYSTVNSYNNLYF